MSAPTVTIPAAKDPAGNVIAATPVILINADASAGGVSPLLGYPLIAIGSTLAGNTAATPVTGIIGGSYIWAYQLGGTSPSLILEALGPDGVNYQTVATVTASGTQWVGAGNNATFRLRNGTANSITGLSSSLS